MDSDDDWLLIDLNETSGPAPIPSVMTEAELSAFLGMSSSRVRNLARDGVLIRSGRARFDVRASVKNYAERMREQAAKAGNPAAGDAEALKAERVRLTRAQADKEEARARREQGELIEAAAVAREWSNLLRDLRNALLAVPSRCGAGLPHLTATDVATIEREIRKALEGLANGD